MINDKKALHEIARDWQSVRATADLVKCNMKPAFSAGASARFADLSYALILPFALSVLGRALVELRDEEVFSCSDNSLSSLMQESRNTLPWTDYKTIRKAKETMDGFVQRQEIPATVFTLRYIYAVESELAAWRLISGGSDNRDRR